MLGVATTAGLAAEPPSLPKIELRNAYPKLVVKRPVWMCESPDGRMFLVEQAGRVLILPKDHDSAETNVFLDISDRKPLRGNEEGLLGFAFHPEYKSNGKFYIYYSQQDPRRSVVSELKVFSNNPNQADLQSERILMEIPQPFENHNGATTIFGPDGFFYIGLGDGGSARDPFNNGQNMNTLLGKIIRIDVNSRTGKLGYGIPKDNPFVGKEGARPEIWALGMRNPWRFSFDRKTEELYAGDVGQDKWEEVDIITRGGNYGWRVREAFHEFNSTNAPANIHWIDPIIEYPHNPAWTTNHTPGLSITGGYVYRGKKNPGLDGVYIYGDFAIGTIWGLRSVNGKLQQSGVLHQHPKNVIPIRNIASFAEDARGEIYMLSFEDNNGQVGRIYELVETKP